MLVFAGVVPDSFCVSYTVPLLKGTASVNSKSLCVDDFRGISISPVISKIFEHCILDKFGSFLVSSDNQFGFKKQSGCNNAIYTLRSVVDYFVSRNTTVNICSLDLSKAFDKMNHDALFIKLMDRNVPLKLLCLIEFWFSHTQTCVQWDSFRSSFFTLQCGVRQGGVLSPYLFALYIDTVISHVISHNVGCCVKQTNFSIMVYADDILLLSPSVCVLQDLLTICENQLIDIDMHINSSKSFCLRIGPDFKLNPSHLITHNGAAISWSPRIRYLGIYIVSKSVFHCSLDHSKRSFYMSFNSIYGKIGNVASEELLIHLVKTKCLPKMLYGLECLTLNKAQLASLDFVVNSAMIKIFKTKSSDVILECKKTFGLQKIENYILQRRATFLNKMKARALVSNNIVNNILAIL